ncbi:right-handed parallel beta-helix repeat-containing protein [Chromobacterium alkanivorans]|uniref:right-handed parallel beta-helix repeat-containing protein n=1 Tax=Chromobacterium alkanivorans TaxID=1071719 RepID=UPI0019681C2A|nr:right-handed parallel beta-helix repeat-containing protein [Chromobacterium alkanivorans]MBN3005004.1 right-handed parallel beta-helix repeat-containing protein [Chromobacterium alkanivorans]
MSLESNVADLVKSANALTGVVNGKIAAIDKRVDVQVAKMDSTMANWGTTTSQILEVGPGKPFKTIYEAWTSLNGKVLRHDVKIKVSDGVHTCQSISLSGQPYAYRIRIEGNIKNPEACVLKFVPDSAKLSQGVIFNGVRGVNFSGFKIIGESDVDKNFTWRGIALQRGAYVHSDSKSIKIEGVHNGVELTYGSLYSCPGLTVAGFSGNGVLVHDFSRALFDDVTLEGKAKQFVSTRPDGVKVRSIGIKVDYQSFVTASRANISQCSDTGCLASNNSVVFIFGAQISDCANYGIYSSSGSKVQTPPSSGVVSNIKDCKVGIGARYQGAVFGGNIKIQNAEKGVYADLAGLAHVVDSAASYCSIIAYEATKGGFIDATGSSAKSIENKVKYSPASSGVVGNANATIIFS